MATGEAAAEIPCRGDGVIIMVVGSEFLASLRRVSRRGIQSYSSPPGASTCVNPSGFGATLFAIGAAFQLTGRILVESVIAVKPLVC